jgi:hypothetical protein
MNNSNVNLMNTYQETGAVNIDFADFKHTKTAGLSKEAMGLGSNLIHELVHVHKKWNDPPSSDPLAPTDSDAKRTTGPVVDSVNRIHSERGLPLRGLAYAPANIDPTIGGRIRVPFIHPTTGKTVYVFPKMRQ